MFQKRMQKYQNSPRFQRSRAASLGDVLAPTRYCYTPIENSVLISAFSQCCLLVLEAKLSSIKIYLKPSSISAPAKKHCWQTFSEIHNIHSWNPYRPPGSPLLSPGARKFPKKTDRSMSICSPGRGKGSRKNSVASLGEHFSSLLSISSQVLCLQNFWFLKSQFDKILNLWY